MRALALKALGQEPETPRPNSNQGPKISFETNNLITSKLKERLAKTRRGVATKKHFERQEHKPISSTILPTMPSLDLQDQKYTHQLGDGFSEKIYENDPIQQKAREGIKLIKRKMVSSGNAEDLQNQASTIIKKMNAQFNYLSLSVNTQNANENKDEKLNLKISEPDSMLHIANYMQNKDFNQITEIATVEDDQILKINARDGLTFFRLHHELDEINRKKDNFAKMKEKYFDKKDPKSLIHYDKELGDIVNNTEQAQQPDKKIPMPKPVEAKTVMSDKEKELVQTAVLKITIKKDKNEKNFYRDFLNGVQNLKEQNKKLEDEKNAQSHYHI